MSMSCYGHIAFGIPTTYEFNLREMLEGEDYEKNADAPEWDEIYYSKKSGTKCPDYKTDHDGWSKWLDEKRAYMEKCGIDMMLSGRDGDLGHNIIIKSTGLSSEWGEAVRIGSLEEKPEWKESIKDFCETMGVPYQEPYWFLTSLYF